MPGEREKRGSMRWQISKAVFAIGSWGFTVWVWNSDVLMTLAFSVLYLGCFTNLTTTLANHGKMPVAHPFAWGRSHTPMTPTTRFRILGDWIKTPIGLVSPGDVLLFLGMALVIGRSVLTLTWR